MHVSTNPPHKRVDVPVQTRLELTRLAFPGGIVVRDDHPYSIDTVLGYGDDAIFLVGADQFAQFLTWREPDEILEHVRLGVATRPGYPRETLDDVLRELRQPERVELFDMQPVPISSSDIRRRASEAKLPIVHSCSWADNASTNLGWACPMLLTPAPPMKSM